MRSKRLRPAALLCLLLLVAAGCGQKSGVAQLTSGTTASGTLSGSTDTTDTTDTSAPVTDTGTTLPGAAAGASAAPVAPGASAKPGAVVKPGATAPPAGPAVAEDRTGITKDTITIGIHAPVTGAAPFPQTGFDRGKDIYWNFVNGKGGVIGGKKVKVIFEDDQFNPVVALQKCKKMVEQDKVFLLVGGGGADQITQCAQYANSVGVPYLSAGVNETGLTALKTYFALSESYTQQSPQLAQLIKNKIAKTKLGIMVADTKSFDDAQQSMTKAAQQIGLEVVANERISKNADDQEALSKSQKLKNAGAEVVYVLASPEVFLALARQGQGQGYLPIYVGPGITSGLDTVAKVGCGSGIGAAKFFSPFPQLDKIDAIDPDYSAQYRAQTGQTPDDIGIALWGLAKTIHRMFEATGPTMSRQSLVTALETGKEIASGVFPPLKYAAGAHLGAGQVHLLEADCVNLRYKTLETFKSSF